MWGRFKDGVLTSCNQMSGEESGRRSKVDTMWWSEEVKEAVSRKKDKEGSTQGDVSEYY